MADLHPDNAYARERFADPENKLEFPPEARQRFEHLLTRYPNKEAALLPTLHLAQEVWGWISPDVVMFVAAQLELTPSTVFGVVSFYNMYNQKPVGKYHLQVCTNLSCMIRGAYDIYYRIHDQLGGIAPGDVTPDGKFTLGEVECLGSCGTAPVVQINNDYHESMDVPKMDSLLDQLRKQ